MDIAKARSLIGAARNAGRSQLSEPEALAVLAAADIAAPAHALAADADAAGAAAARIGLPAVLKVVTADTAHKTDIGGVRVGLRSPEEVRAAALRMAEDVASHPGIRLDGFMVQGLAKGVETVAAVNWIGAFGPVLSFGLGGVLIEVLKDIAQRLVPVGEADVGEMIAELQGGRLLDGWRGAPPADRTAIAATLLSLSALMAEMCDEIAEIEINPLIVGPQGSVAADALIRLHATPGRPL